MTRQQLRIFLLATLVGSAATAQVNVQQQSNGQFYAAAKPSGDTATRYDLVIVGDGFTSGEQTDFNDRVADVVSALEAREPYASTMCAFNIWRVNVVSDESGVDHPADDVFVDTELDVRYGDPDDGEAERCITSDSPAKIHEAAAYAPEADAVFVLANDTQSGGCAGNLVFSSIGSGLAGIVTHELGHKIGALADEYECYVCDGSDSNASYTGSEPSQANCTIATTHAAIKWNDLIDPSTPLPTTVNNPPGVVGIWEGCKYKAKDIYRPQSTCHMRSTGSEFCAVCDREMVTALESHCTFCELADTPFEWFLCQGLPVTKPPWWEIVGLRWPIPPCLSCPPFEFVDPYVLTIRVIEEGVTARVVDELGRVVVTAEQVEGGLRAEFEATRGKSYSLELQYASPTLLESVPQVEVLAGDQRVQ